MSQFNLSTELYSTQVAHLLLCVVSGFWSVLQCTTSVLLPTVAVCSTLNSALKSLFEVTAC
jgi:hypothetical protein